MPRPGWCSICTHQDALAINEELIIAGKSIRATAGQFGVPRETLRRHRDHIPELLHEASRDTKIFEAASILGRIEDLERRTLERLEILEAEAQPDHRTILAAIREQRENVRLVAQVNQLIDQATQVNVQVSDEVINVIAGALTPYPEAKLAVSAALEPLAEIEG